MSRPQYANAFSASYNPVLGEVILGFSQEYPVFNHEAIAQAGKPGAVQIPVMPTREDVCGVVLPRTIALQLLDVLKNTLNTSVEEVKADE